ncbi:MAG: hypothetical protein ACRDZU_01045 [Acidimicrobiales bacterium]
MFTVFCPRHQARVLLGPRAIDDVVNTPDGVVLHWHCRCGAVGTVATGRPSAVADHTHSAASAA